MVAVVAVDAGLSVNEKKEKKKTYMPGGCASACWHAGGCATWCMINMPSSVCK